MSWFTLNVNTRMSDEQFSLLTTILTRIERKLNDMGLELDTLKNEVAESATVMASAVTLINGLAQQIRDLANEPASLLELANTLDNSANALSEAIVANTPSA